MLRKLKRGFTLIEILVAIIILGILTSFAIPSYLQMVNKANMEHILQVQSIVYEYQNLYKFSHGGQFCGVDWAHGGPACNSTYDGLPDSITQSLNLNVPLGAAVTTAWTCVASGIGYPFCAATPITPAVIVNGEQIGLFMRLDRPITTSSLVYCGVAGINTSNSPNPCCGSWIGMGSSTQASGTPFP